MSEERAEVPKAIFEAVVNGRPVTPAQELELVAFIRGADPSTEPADGAALATQLIRDCQRVLAEHPGGRGEKSAINALLAILDGPRARVLVGAAAGMKKPPVRSEAFTA
jgi:hypothetical protein